MLDLPLLGGPVTTHLIGKGPAMADQEIPLELTAHIKMIGRPAGECVLCELNHALLGKTVQLS